MTEYNKRTVGPYVYHGFDPMGEAGDQVYGECIFCFKSNKFYVSSTTGQFDCKSCGRSGNVYSFLKQLIEHHSEDTGSAEYKKLGQLRSLPVEAFKNWGLAFDGERWLIPYFSESGNVRDVRTWVPGHGARSTTGCKVQLFGAENFSGLPANARIFLCEGEWDAMALHWVLDNCDTLWGSADETGWCVVATPGAGTFKDTWVERFSGHRVSIVYDNDGAGQRGADKAFAMLKGVARSINRINWPANLPSGYDIRDLIVGELKNKQTPEKILEVIEALLTEPTTKASDAKETTQGNRIYAVGDIPEKDIPTFRDVVKVFRKHIKMSAEMVDALKIAFAHVFSVDVKGDPLWTYIIGPPGSGKTLLLMALSGSARCSFVSNLTPHSLVSGFKSPTDPSLLPQWDGKCAVLKDFTEILSISSSGREEIYGTLRGAYDGHVRRPFGNGVLREYFLKFSMLAGVTPAIHGDRTAMLGERFLKYEMFRGQTWTADDEISAAINNITEEHRIESKLMDIAGRFLSRQVESLPEVPQWVKDRIIALAQLISMLRANVEREERGGERLKYRPVREVGTRLAKQLVKLAQLIAFVDAKPAIDWEAYSLIERVALDTTIGFHLDLIQYMMQAGGSGQRKQLANDLRIPPTNMDRVLEDLSALRIIFAEPVKQNGVKSAVGRPARIWTVESHVQDLWRRSKIGVVEHGGEQPRRLVVRRKLRIWAKGR